jgi:hypothetical protein
MWYTFEYASHLGSGTGDVNAVPSRMHSDKISEMLSWLGGHRYTLGI